MTSVIDHYQSHLAPIYLWMAGGIEHALALGRDDVAQFLDRPGYAVDLGAGFGMHSIPLAQAGFKVLAVDSSPLLLSELRQRSQGLNICAVESDLLEFPGHLSAPADLILCMGDTLTHLQRPDDVEHLFRSVASSLRPGGQFIATFRDYRELPVGDRRFIPVRSDTMRIHTCFLEQMPERVVVHDIIHERLDDRWSMRVSSYQKLRLSPAAVIEAAESAGLKCRIEPGPRGMVKVLAHA